MRKVAEITISAKGRDEGKTFVLTEMPADQAERWLMRMLEALSKSADVGAAVRIGGYAGLYALGIRALVGAPFSQTEPLYKELMDCVKIKEKAVTRSITSDDVEEVATRMQLKDEVFKLHTGFSVADKLSELWRTSLSALEAARTSKDTSTSDPSAAPSSPPVAPS